MYSVLAFVGQFPPDTYILLLYVAAMPSRVVTGDEVERLVQLLFVGEYSYTAFIFDVPLYHKSENTFVSHSTTAAANVLENIVVGRFVFCAPCISWEVIL